MKQRLRYLFLEPFFGGSHRDFAEGLIAHSRHRIDLLTLPAHFWKWRMRGAALHFAKKAPPLDAYDGLVVTDLMSLADFKALRAPGFPPTLVYFHENQLTYPLAPGEGMDYHFGFTNITTALAADRILFNSRTQFDAFFDGLPPFLNMMPDYGPNWVTASIRQKSHVLYPGCRFPSHIDPTPNAPDAPPLIIWNHRWEFDKDPDEFFRAIGKLHDDNLDFRIALLGENFQAVPKAFIAAKERYGSRIVQYGYVKSREEYTEWLRRGAFVISTAIQENFGISVVEAMRFGCVPLLPHRLSYPEILPMDFHAACLYHDTEDLVEKLSSMVRTFPRPPVDREQLARHMSRYAWEERIRFYDDEFERMALA